MGMKVSRPKSTITPIEAGTYQAVCYGYVDLGTTFSELYQKKSHRCMILWEIPELTLEFSGKITPRTIFKRYSAGLGKKSDLFKHLTSWRGKEFTKEELEGFDMDDIIGANCLLQIIHKKSTEGDVYAVVDGIMHLPKTMPKLKPETPVVSYYIEKDGSAIPETLPDFIKAEIRKSDEFNPTSDDEDSRAKAAEFAEDYKLGEDDDGIPV